MVHPRLKTQPALYRITDSSIAAVLGRNDLQHLPPGRDQEERRFIEKAFLSEHFDLPRQRVYFLQQVHGDRVILAENTENTGLYATEADAIYTFEPDRLLVVRTADCLPVFITGWTAQGAGSVALVHAGWRGLHEGIVTKTLQILLQEHTDRGLPLESFHISIGPGIGQDAYEVGPEVAEHFQRIRPGQTDRHHLDLQATALDEIERVKDGAGVLVRLEKDFHACTFQQNNHFYSHRKKDTERNLNVLLLTKSPGH